MFRSRRNLKNQKKQNKITRGSIKLIILTYFNFFTQVAVYFQEKQNTKPGNCSLCRASLNSQLNSQSQYDFAILAAKYQPKSILPLNDYNRLLQFDAYKCFCQQVRKIVRGQFTWLIVFRNDGLGLLSPVACLFGLRQSYLEAIWAANRDLASLCKSISCLLQLKTHNCRC